MSANQITGIQAGGPIIAGGDIHVTIDAKPQDAPAKNIRFKVDKPIKTFTGREAFLKNLHKVVKKGQITVVTQLAVVAATGGIGKTETIRMYMQYHAHEYDHVIWIDAEKKSSAQDQIIQLAIKLGISTEFDGKPKEFELIRDQIFEKLLPNGHLVLLVFDNAEAFEDDPDLNLSGIKDFLPISLSPFFVEPTVIVTSRQQTWSLHNVIQLDVWTEAEVVTFVIQRLGLKRTLTNETEALRLGNLFGRLPIAMQSAVAVILQQVRRKKNYKIQSLIVEYESGCRKVLGQKPLEANMRPMQSSITMLVLWNLSLEKVAIIEDGNLAIKILCVMSHLSSAGIPKNFLRSLIQNDCKEDSFEHALEILEDYSLIQSRDSTSEASEDEDENEDNSAPHILTIHKMIQDATIENLKMEQKTQSIFNQNSFLNYEDVLQKVYPQYLNFLKTRGIPKWPKGKELLENIVSLGNHGTQNVYTEEIKKLKVTDFVFTDLPKSIELFKTNFKSTPSLQYFGQVFKTVGSDSGIVQTIKELNKQIEKKLTQTLGLEYADIIADLIATNSSKTIAVALRGDKKRIENVTNSRKFYQEMENLSVTQLSEATDEQLAHLLFSNLVNIRESFEDVAEMFNEMQDIPDLPMEGIKAVQSNIAHMQNGLSRIIEVVREKQENFKNPSQQGRPLDQGNHAQQVLSLLKVLEADETQLGSENPSTLFTKIKLAVLYCKMEEFDKALPLLDIEVFERVLGPEHLQTRHAALLLASVMENQMKFKEALALWKKLFEFHKQALGPNHPFTLAVMYSVSVVYYKNKEYEKAIKVAQDVFSRREKELGKDHPSTIKTLELLNNLKEFSKNQNDALAKVIEFTKVDAETARSLLDASKWNVEVKSWYLSAFGLCLLFKVALETFFKEKSNLKIPESEDGELASDLLQIAPAEKTQNNKVECFMELTHVTQEVGQSLLSDSNWNKKVPVDDFFKLTKNMVISKNLDLPTTSSRTNPDSRNENAEVSKFLKLTPANEKVGQSHLRASDKTTEVTVGDFHNSKIDKDVAGLKAQDKPLIPSKAQIDLESQNVTITASGSVSKIEIQEKDIAVQGKAVSKPKPQTTTVSFRLANGKNIQKQFSISDTVKDLYKFVNEQCPDFSYSNYVLMFYPNIQLTKMDDTLEAAKLLNVALSQKMIKQ